METKTPNSSRVFFFLFDTIPEVEEPEDSLHRGLLETVQTQGDRGYDGSV